MGYSALSPNICCPNVQRRILHWTQKSDYLGLHAYLCKCLPIFLTCALFVQTYFFVYVLITLSHSNILKPGRSRRIFQGEKILSTPSFEKEVKSFVTCRIFTACKRMLRGSRTFSGKIHLPFLSQVVVPFTTRVSGGDTWRCK